MPSAEYSEGYAEADKWLMLPHQGPEYSQAAADDAAARRNPYRGKKRYAWARGWNACLEDNEEAAMMADVAGEGDPNWENGEFITDAMKRD